MQEQKEDTDNKNIILALITSMDTGDGCDYTQLVEAAKMPEEAIDAVINELLEEGACFEPKPGKIKKL